MVEFSGRWRQPVRGQSFLFLHCRKLTQPGRFPGFSDASGLLIPIDSSTPSTAPPSPLACATE